MNDYWGNKDDAAANAAEGNGTIAATNGGGNDIDMDI